MRQKPRNRLWMEVVEDLAIGVGQLAARDPGHHAGRAVASLALAVFGAWRFFHLRRSEAHRTYEYYTLLKVEALSE